RQVGEREALAAARRARLRGVDVLRLRLVLAVPHRVAAGLAGSQAGLVAGLAVLLDDREALAGVADRRRDPRRERRHASLALAGRAVVLRLLPAVADRADRAVLAAQEIVAPRLAGADRAVDDPRLAAARAARVLEGAHAGAAPALDQHRPRRAALLRPADRVALRTGLVELLLPLAHV